MFFLFILYGFNEIFSDLGNYIDGNFYLGTFCLFKHWISNFDVYIIVFEGNAVYYVNDSIRFVILENK